MCVSSYTPNQLDHIDLDLIPGLLGVGSNQPDHDLIWLELLCEHLIWILVRSNDANMTGSIVSMVRLQNSEHWSLQRYLYQTSKGVPVPVPKG